MAPRWLKSTCYVLAFLRTPSNAGQIVAFIVPAPSVRRNSRGDNTIKCIAGAHFSPLLLFFEGVS